MEESKWEIGVVSVTNPSVKGLDWLTPKHNEQLKKLLDYAGLNMNISKTIFEQDSAELAFEIGKNFKANVTAQFIKFNNYTKIEIVSSNKLPFYARLYRLIKDEINNKNILQLIVVEGGKIIVDKKEETEINSLDFITIYESLSNKNNKDENITPQAWYDNIPCIAKGCCVFTEPAWVGGPLIPIAYNWCGAKCGSGTPVNSIDVCCRTHDYCYGSFKSYPARCNCDRNLINCLDGIYGHGQTPTLIRTAFRLKMRSQGC
ncbi:hypothetical protein HNQ35_000087 [Cerasibacillus quisquiliarum]|uniref:Phospholipase A2 domain-containing protein n=1 Tax=Cerasibacillus quisquiliarum TaxID=227865 RepID=A0A511UUE7_9BACI|nr:hypothetical protein [Cerasibacillus quisquiliarum]MBB5144898.1 hypothetical protein [Cerasibacillus quisquiliarum]GEN30210.1 hypothetical protein CQU01_04480 [Cerasibacillus quisquiliarum]